MYTDNGFSLVEVSIASLLIMLGVTGYATLQSKYVAVEAKNNLHTVALNLAQEKLTDLVYFQQLSHTEGSTSYQNISTNLGGTMAAGERNVILSSVLSQQTYDIQWQVENFYYVDTTFDGVADSWVKDGEPFFPTNLPRNAALKNVHIVVTWHDVSGDSKQIEMFGSIAPILQSQSFQAKYRSSSTLAVP
jgi:Tfp pilus assembly protein PilV